LSLGDRHIERTSVVGSSNVQSIGMHKKSIEAAKALQEEDEDAGCDDGDVNGSECGKPRHQQPLPISSSAPVLANFDRHQALASSHESGDPSAGAGGNGMEEALRSESIAALRAKV